MSDVISQESFDELALYFNGGGHLLTPGERERIRTRSQQVARIVGCHVVVRSHPGTLRALPECIEPVGAEDAGAFGGDAARDPG